MASWSTSPTFVSASLTSGLYSVAPFGDRDQIPDPIAAGQTLYIGSLSISASDVTFNIDGGDLSDDFEATGFVTLEVEDLSLTLPFGGIEDQEEPYRYTPGTDLAASITAFLADADDLDPNPSASDYTIILDDGAGVEVTSDISAGTFAAALQLRTEKLVRVEADASSGELTAALRLRTEKEIRVESAASAGELQVRVQPTVFEGVYVQSDISAGALVLATVLFDGIIGSVRVESAASAGAMALTATPRIRPPVVVRSDIVAGAMSLAADVRARLPVLVRSTISAGSMSFQPRIRTRNPEVSVASEISAAPMVVSTRIRAFHQETILKDNLRLELQLDGSTWTDLTGACSTVTLDLIAWSSARRYAPDTMYAQIIPSKAVSAARTLLAATWKIPARLREPGVGTAWLGYILPGRAAPVRDAADQMGIEGVDYLSDLDVPCSAIDFRNTTLLEIARGLLTSVDGYTLTNLNLPGQISQHTVEYLARVAGDQTVLSLVDELLHEHGYVMYAGVSDAGTALIQVRRWWNTTLPAARELPTLRQRLDVQREEIQHQAVEVQWAQIGQQDNALLYRLGLPLPDENSPGGALVLSGTSYPFDDEGEAQWFRYRKRWIEAAEAAEDFDLLYASDQRVDWRGDTDVALTTEEHEPLRSRVQVTNEGSSDTRRLLYLDVRGTAVYREAIRKSVVSTTASTDAEATGNPTGTNIGLSGDDLAPVDGAYVGWSARVDDELRTISGWDADTATLTLSSALSAAPAAGDALKLIPPATGEIDKVSAKFLTTREAATGLAVGWRDTIAHGSWSFRALISADDVPPLGTIVAVQYEELAIDRLCQLVRSTETLGDDPLAEIELIGVSAADVAAALAEQSTGLSSVSPEDAEDGVGTDSVWAQTADTVSSIPGVQRPLRAWPYREPESRSGLLWLAEPPDAEPGMLGWRADRLVTGAPVTGDTPTLAWGDFDEPFIAIRAGADGEAGETGTSPNRPPGVFFVERTAAFWSNSTANDTTDFDGGPIEGDRVTQYRGTWVETRRWTGSSWVNETVRIDGNLLVGGSVQADALVAGFLNVLLANIGTSEQRVQIDQEGLAVERFVSGSWQLIARIGSTTTGPNPAGIMVLRRFGSPIKDGFIGPEGFFTSVAQVSWRTAGDGDRWRSGGQIEAALGYRYTGRLIARPCTENQAYDFLSTALPGSSDKVLVNGGATTSAGLAFVAAEGQRSSSSRVVINVINVDAGNFTVSCDNGDQAQVFANTHLIW